MEIHIWNLTLLEFYNEIYKYKYKYNMYIRDPDRFFWGQIKEYIKILGHDIFFIFFYFFKILNF